MNERKFIFLLIILLEFIILIQCSIDVNKNKETVQKLFGENKEINEVTISNENNNNNNNKNNNNLAIKCHNGIFIGKKSKDNVISYKGIPYAKPPIGELRWKEPILAEESNKTFEAYYFGKSPIQTEFPSELGSYYPQMIVFFHGGSYGWGGTSDPLYDGNNLIKKYHDVILITVEYREGLLGFIDFTSVPGGEDYKTSGNLGLLDCICALEWIQKNISNFGGDPTTITIMGESAGGGIVSLLPIITKSLKREGLFKRMIGQSGSINLTYSKKECQKLTELLLEKTNKSDMKGLLSLTEKELIEINKEISEYNNFPERDGILLPEDLYETYETGQVTQGIDLLVGSNKDEVRYWIKEMEYEVKFFKGQFTYEHAFPILYENDLKKLNKNKEDQERVKLFINSMNDKKIWKITEFYNEIIFRLPMIKQAEFHSKHGGHAFVYQWNYSGEDEILGACHGIELSSIFNNLSITTYTGNRTNQKLANEVQDMWINFARQGNPSTSQNQWGEYDIHERNVMILDETFKQEKNLKEDQRILLEPLLKYYMNGCYRQLSMNVPQIYKIGAQLIGTLFIFIFGIVGIIYSIFYMKNQYRRIKNETII
ncbi:alpha/beta-hydrolase [Anaeromyces robustus]|uniref:Carboxylic ester hydrolase n=1 Tax=Anaeromyces robustus TaxID=1754192 RepID=A0A1Y1X1Q3_9FUNG|nr:alpha/beta-hydrolase [Anaeromyces robustus]|eukprot:ORX79264.1 alpha/beta-hydrolase [Anaeromyces robustus]